MLFLPEQADTSVTVLPLKLTELTSEEPSSKEVVDWEFIEMIVSKGEGVKLGIVPDEERKGFQFKEEDYKDAVIMPWYRYAHLRFFTAIFFKPPLSLGPRRARLLKESIFIIWQCHFP